MDFSRYIWISVCLFLPLRENISISFEELRIPSIRFPIVSTISISLKSSTWWKIDRWNLGDLDGVTRGTESAGRNRWHVGGAHLVDWPEPNSAYPRLPFLGHEKLVESARPLRRLRNRLRPSSIANERDNARKISIWSLDLAKIVENRVDSKEKDPPFKSFWIGRSTSF